MTQCKYTAQDSKGIGRWRCQEQEHSVGADGQQGHDMPPNGATAKGPWSL